MTRLALAAALLLAATPAFAQGFYQTPGSIYGGGIPTYQYRDPIMPTSPPAPFLQPSYQPPQRTMTTCQRQGFLTVCD